MLRYSQYSLFSNEEEGLSPYCFMINYITLVFYVSLKEN